ncbi:hypothetical protein CFP56_006674 [Quercus suber]|uniref:Uncharacterized protein n=1 Tax=Quercus suber TaxID=58331 RepID=A0AAW0L6U4_QUESU
MEAQNVIIKPDRTKKVAGFKTCVYPCGTFSWIANLVSKGKICKLGDSCDDFSHSSHVLLLRTSSRVASSTGFNGRCAVQQLTTSSELYCYLYIGSFFLS